MSERQPISTAEHLDSSSPAVIEEHIRFEVRHLLTRLDMTQAAFAEAIGYGEGTVSKWKSGQQRLSDGGAKSIDSRGFGPTTLGVSFSDLLRAYRSRIRLTDHGQHLAWDVFLSVPMAAVGSEYQAVLAEAQRIRAALEEHCGWRVFFAGDDIPSVIDFDTPDLALESNCRALRESSTFVMAVLRPLERPSSVFVEAGFALALGRPSVYFVRDRQVLPYILREASMHSVAAGLPPVRVCETENVDQVTGRIRRHRGELFTA